MDAVHRFPVFFECRGLRAEKQLKAVERYFRVRRRSGGGECGPLTRVKDQVYTVAFRLEEDQQAVLQRSEHVVDGLYFTVQGGLQPHTSSPSQDFTAPVESAESIPALTPPTSGEEYELRPDSYLLRYLKECPEAMKELEKELTSVACTAQLNPEEGRVLVCCSAQIGAACEDRNWKAEIDKLFDQYLCHYEVDPRKVKALLQSRSTHPPTDEVKVYSEGGMAVVVGQHSRVTARLLDVEDSHFKRGTRFGISAGNNAPGSQRGAVAGAPEDGVHVEIIQGTIETQQVDALVSPMLGHDPLSSNVGNTLFQTVGSRLTAKFKKRAGGETVPGDTVLVEDLPKLPSKAVFFLNLIPWDDDPDGCALEVLRMAIGNMLTTCEERGFRSVALPVLGSGMALRFPESAVARVLLEEVRAFERNRAGGTSFLVRVVIFPGDNESSETFRSVQEALELAREVHQPDRVSTTRRIVLLGKIGSGKSNLANTIFGENVFATNHSPNSGTRECQAQTKSVNGRSVTLIDTPGFFDVQSSEEEMKPEILRCIAECAPGPHAFLIVLKVEKFTEQEKGVITKICQYFSGDALKYAAIVFTHGNQLPEGMKIEEFVGANKNLSELVKKCGGRCHVMDNKYWKSNLQDNYRSNQVQVEDLLRTIDKMLLENDGGYYTNAVIQEVEREIRREEAHIKENMSSSPNMTLEEIRKQAKRTVSERFFIDLAGIATGALLGAFTGILEMVKLVSGVWNKPADVIKLAQKVPTVGEAAGVAMCLATVGLTVTSAVRGGMTGYEAAMEAETPGEAAVRAAQRLV